MKSIALAAGIVSLLTLAAAIGNAAPIALERADALAAHSAHLAVCALVKTARLQDTKEKAQDDKKSDAPFSFKSLWKVDVPEGTRRIAVADIADNEKPRLLTLGKDTNLLVHTLAGEKPKQEASLDLGSNADQFVAGHFAKGKPSVIAAPGVLYYRDGDKYVKKEAPDLKTISGQARFADGVENIVLFEGGMQPTAFAVDLSAAKPIIAGQELKEPKDDGYYSQVLIRLPKEALQGGSFPNELKALGLMTVLASKADKKLYLFFPAKKDADFGFGLISMKVLEGGQGDFGPAWKGPKIVGKILDVTGGTDPKGSKKTGLLLLLATGEDGKGRAVEFFAQE